MGVHRPVLNGARPAEAPAPHHCSPSDYMAMIVRLQFIESGEYSPKDFDWRTQAGVLWRMLEYATRPTDASVDVFLDEYKPANHE
jgi:hypothetical protein